MTNMDKAICFESFYYFGLEDGMDTVNASV
jgi:hypothetical protein